MKRASFLLAVLLLGSMSVGCGSPTGNDGPQAAAPSPETSHLAEPEVNLSPPAAHEHKHDQEHQAANIPLDLPPQEVVDKFLAALRHGDESIAAELLTTKARTETAKHDLAVQPPGTPQATYRVGQVEYVTESRDGAHVMSTWTEPAENGQSESYQIVWVLRHQPHGWRIAGMATEVVPGQPPLFLNFEDPADMLQKWRNADAELAEQQPAASPQAAGTDAAARQARQPDMNPSTQQQ